jgi:hypothetical protein
VVNGQSSLGAQGQVALDFDDLMLERRPLRQVDGVQRRASSRTCCSTFELDPAAEASAKWLGDHRRRAHPGYTATNLQQVSADADPGLFGWIMTALGNRLFAQDVAMGALPQLVAAIGQGVESGDYLGPEGPFEGWGRPKKVGCAAAAQREADQEALWERSVALTGVDLPA